MREESLRFVEEKEVDVETKDKERKEGRKEGRKFSLKKLDDRLEVDFRCL